MPPLRIVSLVPAATETVWLLGLGDALVGVSADSDWPPAVRRLPVLNTVAFDGSTMTSREIDEAANAVGAHTGASLYHVDAERLRALRPDLILTQEVCAVCAVSRRDVDLATRALGYRPTILSLSPATLDDVLDDVEAIARAAGVPERGEAEVARRRRRLEAVRTATAGLPRPRVACLEWLDPVYSAGHWVPEMVRIAGGVEGLGSDGGPSRPIAWQAVVDYRPEVLVLIPCSLGLERVAREWTVLHGRPGWDDLPAVRARRVYAGETHLFSQSGPRLVDGVEVLARMLHPEAWPGPLPPDQARQLSVAWW
jgi:iron complex transport system substrate-binding protein